jgi:hypothetical protein
VTVRNRGPVAVPNLTLQLTASRRAVATRRVGSVPANSTRTATVDLAATGVDPGVLTRVRVFAGSPATADPTATRRIVPRLPDLFVTDAGTRVATTADGDGRVNVTVGNRGFAGANATVRVSVGDRTSSREVTVAGTAANATRFRTVTVPVDGLASSTGRTLTVTVRSDRPDGRPIDNAASTTVRVDRRTCPFEDPIASGGRQPRDGDGDGRCEDVNGDGETDFFDVVDLLFALESIREADLTSTQRDALDFDDSGRVGFLDVVDLLFRL